MTRGTPQTKYRRKGAVTTTAPKVIVSFTCDDETITALDALIGRLSADDGATVSASAAIRRAVVYMERATRKGDQ